MSSRAEEPGPGGQQTERCAADASACLEAVRRATPDGFLVATLDRRLVAANDRLFELWGVTDDARSAVLALGSTSAALEALERELAPRVAGDRAYVLLEGAAIEDVRLRDGRVLERHASVVGEGDRRMRAAFFRDVTHRREVNEELLRREAQLRAVFEAPLDAMLVVSDGGRLLDVNATACELLGEAREALVGRLLGDLVPALGSAGPERWDRARPAGRAAGEVEVHVEGRDRRVAEYTAVADIWPGRDLVVLRDVTERRHMAARLALADRMVSVGTLAAGVAHELNNPLAYVSANLSFLSERVARTGRLVAGEPVQPDDADLAAQLADAVRDARDGCERMRMIIRDLRTFSRADDHQTGPVDLARVVDSAVNLVWNEIKHRARLVKNVVGLPPVHGNEGRLGQLFLNLLVNAAHSLPEGRVDEHVIRVEGSVLHDGRIAVEVQDTGSGIPAEHLPRIFDPFFTTKAPGVGTGLGLSICHGIVAGLGGEIAVESQLGRGSTFRVTLRPAEEAQVRPAAAPAPASTARARILVVDDEVLVGEVLARSLRKDHDVTVVTSARVALDRLASGERFDLVLSDLLMPEMSGMDLYDALSARDASLAGRVMFLTGGAFTPAARDFLARTPVTCLEKPFDMGALRAALARKLAEAGRRS